MKQGYYIVNGTIVYIQDNGTIMGTNKAVEPYLSVEKVKGVNGLVYKLALGIYGKLQPYAVHYPHPDLF